MVYDRFDSWDQKNVVELLRKLLGMIKLTEVIEHFYAVCKLNLCIKYGNWSKNLHVYYG